MFDNALGNIATQGVLGSLLVIALLVIGFLYRAKEKANKELVEMAERRVLDLVQLKDVYTDSALTSQKAFNEAVEKFTVVAQSNLEITKNIQNIVTMIERKAK